MHVLPFRSAAKRMAILMCAVCVIDIAAVFLTAKPVLWCARIPGLIPLLTPAAIFSFRTQSED